MSWKLLGAKVEVCKSRKRPKWKNCVKENMTRLERKYTVK